MGAQRISDFARKTGISNSLLGAYLRGEKSPGLDNLLIISSALRVSIDWLATGIGTLPAEFRFERPTSDGTNAVQPIESIAIQENRNSSDSECAKVPILGNESELVGHRIRELIGVESTSSFARSCRLSESVIRTYINDYRMPPLDNAASIAAAGGVTVDWLATGREPKFRKDVVAALRRAQEPEPAPGVASAGPGELMAIYKDAPPEGRNALLALARAIRDRTLRAWLAAGQTIAETASLFDRDK